MSKQSSSLFARLFIRGLGVLLPLAVTISLLVWLWTFLMDKVIGRVESLVRLLPGCGPTEMSDLIVTSISAVALLLIILLMGIWFSGFLGRRLYDVFERMLARLPFLGSIYPYIKQVTEFFFGEEKKVTFQRVVALPYPREGLYSFAFLTGSSLRSLNNATGRELVSVFVPSSPMPATGYTLFVPPEDLIEINMTVEEALRAIVSGGVLVPEHEAVGLTKSKDSENLE
ncbi:MAG: DUF502 domain-containing protein [Planctomycetes bacterium]|jgi:uncharacterized membrane protein|nr:DUF502 domain-containing protein [Planctomycetota bacterium]MBT4029349.1 DUF502 domain-containing protein [Planctomycetota bacterium]MBT4559793.1 DUF502 domain-containing protein [Planctomycetota bacterium]MBT5102279.1 DUF502 domain-containing protein [Planctomycetota bacterium]MBT5120155.1 DUF502 domain-containing protein [Planctomycetota bacterium]